MYDIASHLGKEIDELGDMPVSQFFEWKVYIQMDFNRPKRTDYYLAQIAQRVFSVLLKSADAKKYKINDFLLKFSEPKRKKKPLPVAKRIDDDIKVDEEEEEKKRRLAVSKAYWLMGICKMEQIPTDGSNN